MDKNWQKHLNAQQLEAVTFPNGPLMVLAGAGSGKTRILTCRAAFLIGNKNISPENMLLVTFTNKAAEEMRNRIHHLLHRKVALQKSAFPFAGTFHSFCAKVLRKDGFHLGTPPSFLIYNESDQLETVKEAMQQLSIDRKHWPARAILATISQAKNELISPGEYSQYAKGSFQEIVSRIYPKYQNLLLKSQALDFDDLLVKVVELFQKNSKILERYQGCFAYILVDEYQDTNKAQYELTKLLAQRGQNLTVVGDASQSIYSWRGADFRNLLNLSRDFPKLTVINLEQNYRSTQTILDAAYAVIRHNRNHPILKLWTQQKRGSKIVLYEAGSQYQEAEFIIAVIKKERAKNPLQFSFNDFAVLYRTNAQSRALEEIFMRHGIPYRLIGGVQFYERKEVKDMLAYLKLLANPHDIISLQRVAKLGKQRLQNFLAWRDKMPKKNPPTKKLLEKIIQITKYLDFFSKEVEEDSARLENLKELASVAAEFPILEEFLENVSLVQEDFLPQSSTYIRQKNSSQAITLMTLHSAKGLEFSFVFLVGLEEGLFPHSRSLLSPEEIEEERRLCYVGITRAKSKVFLTYTRRRLWFGSYHQNPVSRFVVDIPEKLLEFVASPSLMLE